MQPELVDRAPTPVGEALGRLESLVSPYVGVVRGVEEVLAAPDDIRLVGVFCQTGRCDDVVGTGGEHRGAGGARTREAARAAAIGEAVERYSSCFVAAADAVVATARELGGEAVAPRRFALYAGEQYAAPSFPFCRFTEDTRVAWVRGRSLPEGTPAYLPAQLVYLGWQLLPGEARIARSTSNGLACHATLEEAVLSGLLELLERDAFMITWGARLSWPLLVWPGHGSLGSFARRWLEPTGLGIAAVDLSGVWSVPTVLGVARSGVPGEAPLGVGAAAAPTVERAVEKALDEAVRVRSWARSIRYDDPGGTAVSPPKEIRTFDEHVRHYAYDENARHADFLDASRDRTPVEAVQPLEGFTALERVRAICRLLGAQGASAYVVDVTSPDVADAGLRVAKTIAPELCPLDVEHAARLLGGRRLYDVPVRLGLRPRPLRFAEINPHPHPFP